MFIRYRCEEVCCSPSIWAVEPEVLEVLLSLFSGSEVQTFAFIDEQYLFDH